MGGGSHVRVGIGVSIRTYINVFVPILAKVTSVFDRASHTLPRKYFMSQITDLGLWFSFSVYILSVLVKQRFPVSYFLSALLKYMHI